MLTLSLSHRSGGGDFDLLGSLLMQVYSFIDQNFTSSADSVVYDNVNAVERPLSELFENRDNLWFVTDECLPGMAEVKAISFTDKKVTFEITPLSSTLVSEGIEEYGAAFAFDDARRQFRHEKSRQTVVRLTAPIKPKVKHEDEEFELGPRILMQLPVPKAFNLRHDLALLLEMIEQKFAFADEDDAGSATPTDMKPKIEMNFQLKLALEQKPILTLSQNVNVSPTLELQQNLALLLAFTHRMEALSQAEAVHYVRLLADAQGPVVAANRLVFALAGKVKRVKPQLSWKDARAIARKKLVQVAQQG